MVINEEVNAAKNTISGGDVWGLVENAEKVVVTSGKKILEFSPKTDDRDEIVTKISGRTGNLRAPALRIGNSYYIGFNDELYERIGKM